MIATAQLLTLDRHFLAAGLYTHRAQLYRYRGQQPGAWNDAHVVKLLELFHVPPHDAFPTEPCACTPDGETQSGRYTLISLPGRSRQRCGRCGKEWLEVHTV